MYNIYFHTFKVIPELYLVHQISPFSMLRISNWKVSFYNQNRKSFRNFGQFRIGKIMILTTSNFWEDPLSTTAICLSPPGVPPRGPSSAPIWSPSCSSLRTCPSWPSYSSSPCPPASLARISVWKINSHVFHKILLIRFAYTIWKCKIKIKIKIE